MNLATENVINVDLVQLNKTACIIKEETKCLQTNYKQLTKCIKELSLYWRGDSAKSFFESIEKDLLTLNDAWAIYKKISNNYSNAVDYYCTIEQTTKSIVDMVK